MCAFDAADLDRTREGTAKFRGFADESDEPEWRFSPSGRTAWPTRSKAMSSGGSRASARLRPMAERRPGRRAASGVPRAADRGGASMDYAAAERYRRGRALRRPDRAVPLCPRHGCDERVGRLGRSGPGRGRSDARARPSPTRAAGGTNTARWALGFVSWARRVCTSAAELTDAMEFGEHSERDRADPAADVGARGGRALARRRRSRVPALPGRARRAASGRRTAPARAVRRDRGPRRARRQVDRPLPPRSTRTSPPSSPTCRRSRTRRSPTGEGWCCWRMVRPVSRNRRSRRRPRLGPKGRIWEATWARLDLA